MFISSPANVVDMYNVINHTIYSSVENGRSKLKEEEQFRRLIRNSLLVSVMCPLVYHLQKKMIISPIELCNPSVHDPERAAPSLQFSIPHPPPPPPKKY